MANKRIKTKQYKQRANDHKTEYQRLTRNSKAKIKRVKDQYGLDLSDRINIPKFEELDTPEKFDSWSDEMMSFTDRANKEFQFDRNKWGIVYSMAELEEALDNTREAQEKAKKFIDKYKDNPYSLGGKETGYTVGDRMLLYEKENVAGISVPENFDINAFQSRARLEGRLELLEEKADGKFFDQSMERMKENFMRALMGSFNFDEKMEQVVDMMDIIPPDDFFELFIMKAEFTFEDYASDGSIDGSDSQLELLKGYLEEYLRGEVDMSLKGF